MVALLFCRMVSINSKHRQKEKMGAPQTLDAIGLGAPAVQQCCRR